MPALSNQDYFIARLALGVNREPMRVANEWSERFTLLRERGDYDGCRRLLHAAKGWPDLPQYGRALVHYAEGWLLDRLGEPDRAIRAYRRAREAFERAGVESTVPMLLTQIGSLHHDRGDYTSARDAYEEALPITHGSDRGRLLIDLGNLHIAVGDARAGSACFREALDLIESDDQRNRGAALHGMGNALMSLRDLAAAQQHFAQAHAEFRGAGDIFGAAGAAASLGVLEIIADDPATAVELLEYSLRLWQALGETRRTADTLNNLAIAHSRSDAPTKAIVLWRECAAIYRELGDAVAAAAVLERITAAGREEE